MLAYWAVLRQFIATYALTVALLFNSGLGLALGAALHSCAMCRPSAVYGLPAVAEFGSFNFLSASFVSNII